MTELELELDKLDEKIKQSIIDTDEFLFAKLSRAKDELNQKIFFAESRRLKSDIENLETERACNLSIRADLQVELTAAADVVLVARNALYEAETAYSAVQAKQFFNDSQLQQQREDLAQLKSKLARHIELKLTGENKNE